jgi:ribosomal protein L37AE/L43A
MQSNPNRIKSSWCLYCGRTYHRYILAFGIWMWVTCGCCYKNNANIRLYQKYDSKKTTLRSHRK